MPGMKTFENSGLQPSLGRLKSNQVFLFGVYINAGDKVGSCLKKVTQSIFCANLNINGSRGGSR